jgi:hypothetical protein
MTDYQKAYEISRIISWCCIVLLLLTGAFVLYLTRYNISLLLAGMYLAAAMGRQ